MFLTRFEINRQRRQSRQMLASPQRIHAAVLHSFSGTQLDTGRVLWRLDHGHHNRVELLIMSPEPPDLSALVEECGWPSTTSWQTADYSGLLSKLRLGQRWRFRLTGNPTKSLSRPNREASKRVPVIGAHQLDWLAQRGERFGFTMGDPPTASVTRRDLYRFRRNSNSESGREVTLSAVQFDGHLTVTDPIELRAGLIDGIGPAKGYGCGLLTLAPTQ